jgi:dolichyl-phosphate beta-glucosyltransferase
MHLSIVIPILNEERKISRDIREAIAFFSSQQWVGEVIVVDDGSKDSSAAVVKEWVNKFPDQVRLISYQPNQGKGHAVKRGVLAARGNMILFADSGYCVPFQDAQPGMEMLQKNEADIVHGSRNLKQSKIVLPRPWHRQFISFLFRRFVKIFAGLPRHITDSQCGFKIYRQEVGHQLSAQCQTSGFMFDVEVILLARKLGFTLREIPVRWTMDPDSRINLRRNLGKMMKELWGIKKQFR